MCTVYQTFHIECLKNISSTVMFSDVTVKVFHLHMTICEYHESLRFLHKAFSILTKQTRHSFHKTLLPQGSNSMNLKINFLV